jgi:hypothetical protein
MSWLGHRRGSLPCPDHPDGRLLKRVVLEQLRPGKIEMDGRQQHQSPEQR